jgi:hypothetical protein
LKRIGAEDGEQNGGIEATRGVLQGAMAVHLARYLNVPPTRLPGEDGDRLDDLPHTIERTAWLSAVQKSIRGGAPELKPPHGKVEAERRVRRAAREACTPIFMPQGPRDGPF